MKAPRRRPPPLYRLARGLRWSALLALILVLLFLASTIVSAVQFVQHASGTGPGATALSFQYAPSTGFTVGLVVNVTNAGTYPLVLDLSTMAETPRGPLVPWASTGPVPIAPGNRTTPFGLTLHIPTAILAANASSLLLHDAPIAGEVWVNGTYAWIYRFGARLALNGTWGAPFENLTVRPGLPTAAGGGTTVPVNVSFSNHAVFAVTGAIDVQVTEGGAACGPTTQLPIDTAAHQNFTGAILVSGPSSCMVPGATVVSSFVLGTTAIPLASTRIA